MSTIDKTAAAFANGTNARCGNAKTDGTAYYLHGHRIARRTDSGQIEFDWCGWYTPTTASHMNAVLAALGHAQRVSYAQARDGKTPATFTL